MMIIKYELNTELSINILIVLKRKEFYTYYQMDQNYYLLKKFNWLLTLNFHKQMSLLDINDDLKEAYYLYIDFDYFYQTSTIENAKSNLERIIDRSSLSNISEIQDFSNTLKRWKSEIINSFIVIDTYVNKHSEMIEKKINNGIIENKKRGVTS